MEKLSNRGVVKDVLARHGFTFSKGLGQNFLVNPAVCPRMIEESFVTPQTAVLEIGPGLGVLTREAAAVAKKVVSVEIDERLKPVLAETLADFDNIDIVWGDFLKLDLNALFAEHFAGFEDIVICANLPYYITSPIIMKILEERAPARCITTMVQKEAAERICAPPGARAGGAISLAINYYAAPKRLFSVSRGSFMPAPDVDSAVIRLDIHKSPPVDVISEQMLFAAIKAGFSKRRKTLSNSLSSGLGLSKDLVNAALSKAKVPASSRAEAITLEDFANIANNLSAN